MILNRTGAEFAYEGVTYTIGGAIVGTAESEYAGLYGRINAIHDGEDKETENETPDIYCEFDPPVMPHEVKALEDTFSDLYHQPKTIADIVLDMVSRNGRNASGAGLQRAGNRPVLGGALPCVDSISR